MYYKPKTALNERFELSGRGERIPSGKALRVNRDDFAALALAKSTACRT